MINKTRKSLSWLLLLGLLFQSTVSARTPIELSSVIKNNFSASSSYSFSLLDSNSGEELFTSNKNSTISPASGLKLLTGAAALATLGKDYRFKTNLYYDGTLSNGVLNGNLYFQGSGDPTLKYYDLQTFAGYLKYIGIKHINGYVFGDDSHFSGNILSPGAKAHEQYEYYAASTPAITLSPNNDFNAGSINIVVNGTKIGLKPIVMGEPSLGDVGIINNAKTVSKSSKNTLTIKRNSGSNQIVVSGEIPIGRTTEYLIAVNNPKYTTLTMFVNAIKARGITFSHKYLIATRKVPDDAVLIHTKKSMTLEELYPYFMKKSNNQIADILVKTMGYEITGVGDLENGLTVVRDYGTSLGLDMTQWTLVDGSGLSVKNKVSSKQMALLLYNVQDEPYYKVFYKGLIVGGHPNKFNAGALYNRFKSPGMRYKVVGKTGSIFGVYTLSGYVKGNKTGNTYIFSLLTDKNTGSIGQIDNVIEHIISNY